ncbi:uncharacterized protein LOC129602485 [Paramacrobiotus metropolitanus]|uniref:uncharacterized protein LOC129602485 n=1 Tax=Paramacrobiotus metropolitanus TaxID=2943436 RepID=UPI0024459CE8|nr:uncharacterized protein LOC129602485 [Paramacrobiotus metropolitanus]
MLLTNVHAAKASQKGSDKAHCKQHKPPGYSFNNEAGLGIWYQYMYGPPDMKYLRDRLTNAMEDNRRIGWLPGQSAFVQSFHVTARLNNPPYTCWKSYGIQNTTKQGFCYGSAYFKNAPFPDGERATFYKLYMNSTFTYARSFCFDKGSETVTAESCAEPGISVWTRKKPQQITAAEDRRIRQILEQHLQLYCMTSADMVKVPQVNLPVCQVDEPSAAYKKELTQAQRLAR